ncbi:hypothetical protein NVP3058O_035 [Vibrio phage 3.058.O._10N.286.46.B8]|nr:hypothetical protein NVP2058O_036 [Vibrio phage 2.058.O._10N.286.46.B8]AUS03105.1 hypothetical protein NVP3058O_035 [Vibrio phage 3.058.O._10N.286.46.B8]
MAINTDPYYYIKEDHPTHTAARATALEVMGEARRYDENVRVGWENRYYVDGLKHYRMSGVEISKSIMLEELINELHNGKVVRVDNIEWSI